MPHSGEEKVECPRYRNIHGLNDDTPRLSSAFGLTRRKTSPSHLHTSNNKRPAVTQFRGGVRESATAVPRILPSVKQTSYRTDKQDLFTHDEDDLQQMNVVKAFKDEITDLKQLLHNSNQQINKMKVRETEIKEYSKDQIFELQQKIFELQKQQEREQQEALLGRTLEESSEIIEIKKKEQKLHEMLSKAIQLCETEKMKNRQLLLEISQLNEEKHYFQQQAEIIEETIHSELADKELKYKNDILRLQQTSVNIEPSINQLITENEKLKTINENLEKVAVEMGSRFDSIKTNFDREKAQLEDTKTRLREISEVNQSKDKQVFELRTKLEHTEKKFQEARMNDEHMIQDLESEKSKLASWYDSELSTYKQLVTDIEKRVHELSKENHTLKELSKESETRTAEDIKIMKNLLQKTETELEENKARYLEERLRTKHEIDGLKSKLEDTEAKVTKEKQERLNMESEKQRRDKEITQLQRTITSLEQQIEQLRQENKKYKKDIDHQRQMYEKNENDNTDIQRQLYHKETEIEKKETELIDIKRRYSEERSRTKHEINDLKSKAKMTKEKQERLNLLENEMQCRGKEITQLQQTITSHEQEIEQLRQENEKCKRNIDRQKQLHEKKSTDASSELRDTKTRLHTLYDEHERNLVEISELRSRLGELEQTSKRAYEKVNRQERENARLASESSDLDKRIKDIIAENDALRSNLKEARSRLQKEEQARKDYESNISKLQMEKQKFESCKADQEATINQMRNEISTLKKTRGSKQTAGYSDSDYDDLYRKLRRREEQLKEVETELEDTKTRLSKCTNGNELTNNNPNIVCLSDINRPSKLAERYKELYDNQWTDAYEILEESLGAEEQIIKILQEILIETKRFCDNHTEMEMDHILKVITRKDKWQQSDVPVSVIQYIIDRRKSTVAETMKTKYKEYVNDLRQNQLSFVKHALCIDAYLQECFEVCWLMAIQDPPVVLAPVSKHCDTFKTDLYSAYTVTGKIVDYVVWPALLLHTNGPTLTKGVAQGMRKSGSR